MADLHGYSMAILENASGPAPRNEDLRLKARFFVVKVSILSRS